MTSLPPFNHPGRWFKGHLHTHSSESDGKLTPLEVVQWHAEHGYHFLAITDHDRVTHSSTSVKNPPLLVIPSAEISARRGGVEYHVLSINIDKLPIESQQDPQATIAAVNAVGGLCFIGHPYWHDHTIDDLLALTDYIGIEIFNTGCWLEIQKGHSLVHWDGLLRRGKCLYGLAVDDSHWSYPDHGKGWVVVRAEKLDIPSILAALRQGLFYSTMGPEVFDVQLEGRQVKVHCSPVKSIFLVGEIYHCPNAAQVWDDQFITSATFTLHPKQKYLRVEVVDSNNRSAWTNAYFVEEK